MDEYIKREDAINTAYELYEETDFIKAEELSAFIKSIPAPAEDVVPVVRGKWINDHNGRYSPLGDNFFCSICKEPSLRAYNRPAKTNFCPNCGASMKDSDDE